MKATELRIGNIINTKQFGIQTITGIICGSQVSVIHFSKTDHKLHCALFLCDPVPLTPERLETYGFIQVENYFNGLMEEYVLSMPVKGSNKNEIYYYFPHTKQNTTPFGRYAVNGYHGSNNFVYEHELQNIYFSLTGEELKEKIPA